MCDRLTKMGLTDVGEEGFWDTTGTVTSGQYEATDYVFHSEPDTKVKPDENKLCILTLGLNSPFMGETCFRCANKIFLRKKANLNPTH